MIDWRKALTTVAVDLESQHEERRLRVEAPERITIIPYRGFGNENELVVRGRALVEKAITRADEGEPLWRNLLNAYRRFDSDEVAGAPVRATFENTTAESATDSEGYFEVRLLPARRPASQRLWHEVKVELVEHRDRFPSRSAGCPVLIPPATAEFIVASDIDDTIIHTGATELSEMLRRVLLENARARLPMEGVATLYEALQKGVRGGPNPIFYISSSPWNLYEFLEDFLRLHGIPPGPMFLQDFGIDPGKLIHLDHEPHKKQQLELLLKMYPSLPFVLVGDSGQKDPEIYLQIARAHAGRIAAIFIRDVSSAGRDATVRSLMSEAASIKVEMLYVADSTEAAAHAERLGLIEGTGGIAAV